MLIWMFVAAGGVVETGLKRRCVSVMVGGVIRRRCNLDADKLVLAAGAWSSEIARGLP